MMKTLAISAIFLFATASQSLLARADSSPPVGIRKATGIPIGGSKKYDGGGLHVTFVNVTEDSRCPINARCIRAGNAKIILRVQAGNQKAQRRELNTNDTPDFIVIPAWQHPSGTAGIPKSYILRIAALSPQPYIGWPFKKKEYRLRLSVKTAW